ncbi:MAG TPA: hypothetical protein PKA95_04870 [Thermomicrobiales bacterium]|nr:hypothetical protein [Thermomicrobiales bacterium]
MSASPVSPPVFKGAIVGIDPFNPLASIVVFQYNPASLDRSLQARTAGGEGGVGPVRLAGPPEESIKLSVILDATDQLQRGDPVARDMGIYPALSALEMLLYPKSALVIANEVLARAGVIEVIPMEAPLTLLIWGPRRILPVRITDFSIAEEAFDTLLNPTRARVDLGLRVLTYDDLGMLSHGGALFMVNQVAKEVMATIGSGGSLAAEISAAL